MKQLRFSIVLLVSVAAGVGCGDDPEPDLGGLDPLAVVSAADGLLAPLDASRPATVNLAAAMVDLESEGVEFRRATDPVVQAVEIPTAVQGKTFAYGEDAGRWEVDDSRSGAPPEGVRVIWYALDGSGELADPLTERGHIDLTGGDDPTLEELAIVVIERVGDEESTLLDLEQGYRLVEGAEWSTYLEAAGSAWSGEGRTDFTIVAEESGHESTGDGTYEFTLVFESADARYELGSQGEIDGTTAGYEDHLESVVDLDGSRTRLRMLFTGQGTTQESASGTLEHDGRRIADVTVSGSSYSFSDPEGGEFSSAQAGELSALFRTLLLNGFAAYVELPLIAAP